MMVVGCPLVVSLVVEGCQNQNCHKIVHQKSSCKARTCESKHGERKGCDCCETGDDKRRTGLSQAKVNGNEGAVEGDSDGLVCNVLCVAK